METLVENKEFYDYLEKNYSTTYYRFERLFGHMFPYKKLDFDKIVDLKINGINNLSGINELKNLEKIWLYHTRT